MEQRKDLYKEFKKHIIDITNGYDESHLNATYKEKAKELIKNFKTEHGSAKMIQYHRGLKQSFITWLNGLPSCIETLYTYYDVENFWKSIDETLWNTIKDMDYSELYRIYIYETLNKDFDIASYIFNAIELERLEREEQE